MAAGAELIRFGSSELTLTGENPLLIRPLRITPDIPFNLEGDSEMLLSPGETCWFTRQFQPEEGEVVTALKKGDFTLRSRAAIVGLAAMRGLEVIEEDNKPTEVRVEITNTGPATIRIPQTYDLLRAIDRPSNPLIGEELFLQAQAMGNQQYVWLRDSQGNICTVGEAMQEDPEKRQRFTSIVLPYTNEMGIIARQPDDIIDLAILPGRAEGLEDWLPITWVPFDPGKMPNHQRVILQKTYQVKIPQGFMALISKAGLLDGPAHSDSVGLDYDRAEGARRVERDWGIFGEHNLLPGQEVTPLQGMVIELFAVAV